MSNDEDVLMGRLRKLFSRVDRPPAAAMELVRQSFGLRTLDAELAELVADSAVDHPAVAVRAGTPEPRLLTFEAPDLAIEVQVGHGGLVGQLIPPVAARIALHQPTTPEPHWTAADERGRFAVENLVPGPFRLTCHRRAERPVTTAWVVQA